MSIVYTGARSCAVGQQKNLIVDSPLDRQPVKHNEGGCDVLMVAVLLSRY